MIESIEASIEEQKKEKKENIPEFQFDVTDLAKFANEYKNLNVWKEKGKVVDDQLKLLLKKRVISQSNGPRKGEGPP